MEITRQAYRARWTGIKRCRDGLRQPTLSFAELWVVAKLNRSMHA